MSWLDVEGYYSSNEYKVFRDSCSVRSFTMFLKLHHRLGLLDFELDTLGELYGLTEDEIKVLETAKLCDEGGYSYRYDSSKMKNLLRLGLIDYCRETGLVCLSRPK